MREECAVGRLLPDQLHQDPFSPLAIKLAVKNLFPGYRTPSWDFMLYAQCLVGCRDSNPNCCDWSQVCYISYDLPAE